MPDNREALINQLAASMGAGDFAKTKYSGSYYDAGTGTLYCRGLVISKSTAEKAMQHFETLANKCNMEDAAGRENALMYMCAVESIKLMQNEQVREILRKSPDVIGIK